MTGLSPSTTAKNHQCKKVSHIDMTPMVDLGFLLITFFIFTSTLFENKALGLIMPAQGPPSVTGASKTLTVVLGKDNAVSYYHGKFEAGRGLQPTSYHTRYGVGNIIREKQKLLGKEKNDLMIIINPSNDATYDNVINILDEIKINGVSKYAITEMAETSGFGKR
ncbi:MAG: biopolymer transporter ExbD [Chitinophagaceae bacterium]